MYLYELDFSVTNNLKISPALMKYLKKQEITSVQGILEFYPNRYQDRSQLQSFPVLNREGESLWLSQKAKVVAHESFFMKGKTVLKIRFQNQAGQQGVLLCFNRCFLAKVLSQGVSFLVYGSFSFSYGEWCASSFDFERIGSSSPIKFGKIVSLYKGQTRVNLAYFKLVSKVLERYLPILEDDVPHHLKESEGLLSFSEALTEIHAPTSLGKLEIARKTLVIREIFWLQVKLMYQEKFFAHRREKRKLSYLCIEKIKKSLPFPLTEDQEFSLKEIYRDLQAPLPMNRLLQGDVGTGKTLVAFLSALPILEYGEQVAFMVPTEVLARQQLDSFKRLGIANGIDVSLLSSSMTSAQKKETLEKIRSGISKLVVGTHSLFSETVRFANLGYIIVDEQHKFGISQREKLLKKGFSPDLLLMSATPIPRTMALAFLGNISLSTLRQLPGGRLPITTYLVEKKNQEKVYIFMEKELKMGNQVYFVHPVIKGLELGGIEDIDSVLTELQRRFPDRRISLLHSRLQESKKQEIIEDFISQKVEILLTTSIVEVGIDADRATVMVVSYAHRFGLASLHQLRGRVGRRLLPSFCFLIYTLPLENESKKRLRLIRESQDGFYLAQKDLEARGSGNFQGEEQSGQLVLTITNLERDHSIFWSIRDQVLCYFTEEFSLAPKLKASICAYLKGKLKKQDQQ